MESCIVNGNINNDFLSQSYSESIERITGTKDSISNFQIPKELLEVREKTWDNLFDKYSKDMSDDVELNVDTLEPEEDEEEEEGEKAVSEEEYSCGQRVPMRKSATLVQYWINTGNPPYKMLLEENEPSETGSSLSEKEMILSGSSSAAPITNIGNAVNQSSSCEETGKVAKSSISQRNLNVQSINDIASIFRQFDKTSNRLSENVRNNDVLDQRDETLEVDTFCEKQMSEDVPEIIAEDTSLTAFHRKKLYTGRNSPVDLIPTETHGTNRISKTRESLHPALDPGDTIKRKTFFIHKDKNKHSLSAKKNVALKKVKRKERRELDKTITDISDKYNTNDEIQDSKSSSDLHNNSGRQDDRSFREYDDTNISVTNEKYKQHLASLNLRPVVLLDRIEPSFERRKLKFCRSTHKKNVRNNKFAKLHSCEIENVDLELETADSDVSTILICQCNIGTSQRASSLSEYSLDLRLTVEDDLSASNAERKDEKLSSLQDTDRIQNKELIWQKEISNKSKTHFSNQYGTNKEDNIKLREIKVHLERLSPNVYLKKSSNVTNTNIIPNKTNISPNTSLQTNNKRKSQIGKISQIFPCENGTAVRPVSNNHSLRTSPRIRSKKSNDTFDIVAEHASQVFDKIDADSTFQQKTFRHKKRSKVSQNNHSKYSVFNFSSSDEDDFVQSIKHPRKRSKVLIDVILDESNIAEKKLSKLDQTKLVISDNNKYCYSRNSSTVICSSKETVERDVGSIKVKKKHRVVEIKSFDSSTQAGIASLQNDVTTTVRKSLTFQTKSYYDSSDSSETL